MLRGSSHDTNYAAGVESDTTSTSSTASTTPVQAPIDFGNLDLDSPPQSPLWSPLQLLQYQGLLTQDEAAFVDTRDTRDRLDRSAASALQRRALRSFIAASTAASLQLERQAAAIAIALGDNDRRIRNGNAGATLEALQVLAKFRRGLATKKRFLISLRENASDIRDQIFGLSSAANKRQCLRCEAAGLP